MYGDFASVYDRLMGDVDYPVWGEYYHGLLNSRGVPEGALVMEAACGTGSLTLELAKRYQLLPSDQSEEMLGIAVAKARAQGHILPFVCQDMRELSAHRPAQALVAGCDGVNYLLSLKDLRRFLNSAHQALAPGGAIAFDISSHDKLSRVLGNNTLGIREEDICCLWQNAWQPASRRVSMALTIFTRQADMTWRMMEEHQAQRAWRQEEITKALTEAGFGDIACHGEMTLKKPAKNAQRLHFVATKK